VTALFGLDLQANVLVLAIVSLLSSTIITFGYHNTMFSVKNSLMAKREVSSHLVCDANAPDKSVLFFFLLVFFVLCVFFFFSFFFFFLIVFFNRGRVCRRRRRRLWRTRLSRPPPSACSSTTVCFCSLPIRPASFSLPRPLQSQTTF
jgi:hypothetical protein